MKRLLWTLVALGALLCAAIGAGTAGAAGAVTPHTCSGGTFMNPTVIPAGTYASLTVTGNCSVGPVQMTTLDGTVHVLGNVTIASHASLDAITGTNLKVGGNVWVGSHAILGLGCSPAVGCAVTTSDSVGGNLTASGADSVIVHSTNIGGSVSQSGGGGSMNPAVSAPFGGPFFSDYEDNHIGGNVTVSGLMTFWFGFIRNHTGGSVTLTNNHFGDPDADEIVTNVIHGNLSCSGNSPAPQVGDSTGHPNVVFGRKTGQCANIQ